MPHVAIILVNWNGKNDTIACLASIFSLLTSHFSLLTIVVDNGSDDNSVEVIRKKFPRVEVIEAGGNMGFTGGNNLGIKRALETGAQFVWLLNNDTVVDKNALTSLVDAFDDGRVGIAGSKIYFRTGHEYHKDRYIKKDLGRVLWYAGGVIDWQNMYAAHRGVDEVDRGQYDEIEETQFVTGCSMMIRRNVFDRIGLLDGRFFAYLEDVDFCLRAGRAGFILRYVPWSVVWHNNAGSSGGVGSRIHEYYMTRNRLIVGMRYASIRTKAALLREAMRMLVSGPAVRRKAVLDAIYQGRPMKI
jgi:GT2 family glycosyltransferase